jgi:hypothetical protein
MKTLLVLFGTLYIHICCAQSMCDKFGFRVGYSESAQSPKWDTDQLSYGMNDLHSAYLGLDFKDSLSPKWGYSVGVQFCEKGYQSHYVMAAPSIYVEVEDRYELSYLDLPICLIRSKKAFSFKFGIVPSILLAGSSGLLLTTDYSGYYISSRWDCLTPKLYKTIDIAMTLGCMIRICPDLDFDFNIQKGFINPNRDGASDELGYQVTALVGIRYHFLRSTKYLVDRNSSIRQTAETSK